MPFNRAVLPLVALLVAAVPAPLRAGLYYSGETFAEFPTQWRGFLLDQRALRMAGVKPADGVPAHPFRTRYLGDLARLDKLAQEQKLTADQSADRGALLIRLGEVTRALGVLRTAQRERPEHFRLCANLGTAWQLHGDLDQAAAALQQAVHLAPGKYLKVEEMHLKLVRLRQRKPRNNQALDDLFGVRFVSSNGQYVPGQLAVEQRKNLPANAVAIVQQLALALPADGRLLWLLAELAAVHGDVPMAAAIMDGCVTEFGLRQPDLLAHRRAARAGAERPADKFAHEGHAGLLKTRSLRPLPSREAANRPPIDPNGVNALSWTVILDTTLSKDSRPTFPRYLKELSGKKVQITGYMQPLGEGPEHTSFLLIENPVGCWYCEMPGLTGMVLVEVSRGSVRATRSGLRVTGRLALNVADPESFLYTLEDATVTAAE